MQDSVGGAAERLAIPLAGTGTNIAMAGTTGNDTITLASAGTYANAVIWGQGGVDTLTGGSGADTIYGGAGADVITANTYASTPISMKNFQIPSQKKTPFLF